MLKYVVLSMMTCALEAVFLSSLGEFKFCIYVTGALVFQISQHSKNCIIIVIIISNCTVTITVDNNNNKPVGDWTPRLAQMSLPWQQGSAVQDFAWLH